MKKSLQITVITIFLFAGALVILETTNIQRNIFECPDKNGYYAHNESCEKYWSCVNKKATLKICPDGLAFYQLGIFHPQSAFATCRLRQQVNCRDNGIEFSKNSSSSNVDPCPNEFGIHSLGPNCNNFKVCRWGQAGIHYCPPMKLFDETNVACVDAPETPALCDSKNPGFKCPNNKFSEYPHETYCDKYWRCQYGKADLERCPDGLAFQPSSNVSSLLGGCQYLHKVNCSYRNQLLPAQSSPHCPRANGYFAHEGFNDSWWYCLNGTAYQSTCDHGYLWNDAVKSCLRQTNLTNIRSNE